MILLGRLDEYDTAVEQTHTYVMRSAVAKLKNQGRRAMERAGLGTRLPHAFRGRVLAENGKDITRAGVDANPRGIVASRAFVKRSGATVDLIDVFQRGAVIVPRAGSFLAIPTQKAGGARAKPMGDYPEGTFRLIPRTKNRGRGRRGGRGGFYAVHRTRGELWYILVPQVRLRRRLNLDAIYRRVGNQIPAMTEKQFARQVVRLRLETTA